MHIYLYDLEAGSCRQLTSGEWVVRAIEHWDAEQRVLYFSAAGREQPGVVDPYLRHLYSIPIDQPGTVPTLLTPEPADHAVKFSPDGCRKKRRFRAIFSSLKNENDHSCQDWLGTRMRNADQKRARFRRAFFTDCYSRADLPTVAVLRAASDGRVLLRLEAADLAPLLANGWRMPVPFVTTAPDGITPLHSLFWPPHCLGDENNVEIPEGSVPVLENIYTGMHRKRSF
jgi:dipeptidyl-peptidase-4